MGVFADFYYRYADMGLLPIPVEPGTKIPRIKDWPKIFAKGPLSPEDAEKYIKSHGHWSIGICLGMASGIVAFDYDYTGKHADILKNMILSILEPSPVQKIGKKGFTAFYRCDKEMRNRTWKRPDGNFADFLSMGKQTVIPPSPYNEDGSKNYEWLTVDNLLNFDIKDLPLITNEQLDGIEEIANLPEDYFHNFPSKNQPRRDKVVGFVLYASNKSSSAEELVKKAFDYDMMINGADPKGPFFSDPKYHKHLKPMEFCEKEVLRLVKWKEEKKANDKIPWKIGQKKSQAPKLKDSKDDFFEFFKEVLKDPKRDILSGEFLVRSSESFGGWAPVWNMVKELRSSAHTAGLNRTFLEDHLASFETSIEPSILLDMYEWDGVDRIKMMCDSVQLKGDRAAQFEDAIKEWMANIWRRLYQNGEQNRCIILKGDQNLGKDTWVKTLLSGFERYYAKFTINSHDDRQIYDQVTNNLALHIEEFDRTAAMSVAFLKDLITRDSVTYRSAYAKANQTRKCVASFISTVNIDTVLRDETGNRRFAVFDIDKIIWDYPKDADFSKHLFAQSFALCASDYRAQPGTWAAVKEGNEPFEMVAMEPNILEIFDAGLAAILKERQITFAKNIDIMTLITDIAKWSSYRPQRILSILKSSGRSIRVTDGYKYYPYDTRIPHSVRDILNNISKKNSSLIEKE